MTDIANLGRLVARILDRLDEGTYREGFAEPFQRGSAAGKASVVADADDPGEFVFQVEMAIMRAPAGQEPAFYRRLLELNHDFQGRAAFSLADDGGVTLLAARPIRDLDPSEVVDLILWTSEQADRYDDVLLKEFGYARA
jgi:hypothetical protein